MQKWWQFPNSEIRSKFCFEVGGGPGSHTDSGAETVRATSNDAKTETTEDIAGIFDRISGALKPEEMSEETKDKLAENKTYFQSKESEIQQEIDKNNQQISTYQEEVETLQTEKQSLEETNDADAESNIILGLMPNSHEEFMNFVKTNRPSSDEIRNYLQSDALEDVSDEQIQAVLPLASQMVTKLNKIDEITKQIKEKKAEIAKLEAINQKKQEEKKANLETATTSFQRIVEANIKPDAEDLDGKSAEELEDLQRNRTQAIWAVHNRIAESIRSGELPEPTQQTLISNLKKLEHSEVTTQEEALTMILAGVEGVTAEELKASPYFADIQTKLNLMGERSTVRTESDTRPEETTTDTETEDPLKGHETFGPDMEGFYQEKAVEKTGEIWDAHNEIAEMIRETELSPEAQQKIIANIKKLEYYPGATEEEFIAIVLAGVEGVTAEELKASPYFARLQEKLTLIKQRNDIQVKMTEVQKAKVLRNISNLVEIFVTNDEFFAGNIAPETRAKLNALKQQIDSGAEIDFQEASTLITQVINEVSTSTFDYDSYNQGLSERDPIEFDRQKKEILDRLGIYRDDFNTYHAFQAAARRRAAEAEATRKAFEAEIGSMVENPEKFAAAQAIAATKAFRETGTISAPLAEFITNPDTDFSSENVQRIVNLMNSEAYLNASPEQQAELFLKSVDMPSGYPRDREQGELTPDTSSFINALPQGVENPQVLANGNIAYTAGGVDIEVDIRANKMFPRSADGRAQEWLSMSANPINTPAIQFFSAAMEASIADKEDGFAAMVRSGGVWKNEIFWRNLLAPNRGRTLQPKEIEGIQSIENRYGTKALFTEFNLIDESGNLLPGNVPQVRQDFFATLIAAANGNFERFENKDN